MLEELALLLLLMPDVVAGGAPRPRLFCVASGDLIAPSLSWLYILVDTGEKRVGRARAVPRRVEVRCDDFVKGEHR